MNYHNYLKELRMYRYSRTVTIKNGASMPPALRAGAEVTAHLNKTYGLQMQIGAEFFGDLKIHWTCDIQNLDSMPQLNSKLLQDKAYWEIMEKIKPFVLDGSVQDRVIAFSS
jgi:hypothetical protein